VGIPLASFLASVISGAGILIDLRKRIPVDFSHLWKPGIPILLIGMCYLPFFAAPLLWQGVARWTLGVAIVAWSGWWALREFRPNHSRVATA
jgi:hypothetical protein